MARMAKEVRSLSKSQPYVVLGLIAITIIAFTIGLNEDKKIYLWDRNVIPISDEGKTVDVELNQGLTI